MFEENIKRLQEYQKNKHNFFSLDSIKCKKTSIFGEDCINKNKFHIYEKSITIDKVDIKRMVLSNKESYDNKGSLKYFIGYIYIYKRNALPPPLVIKFPKMNA